jgi:hypothetical protein
MDEPLDRQNNIKVPRPYDSTQEQVLRDMYDKKVSEVLRSSALLGAIPEGEDTPEYEVYEDDATDPYARQERDTFDTYDRFLNAEVLLPIAGEMLTGKVDAYRKSTSSRERNPRLARLYTVKYPDDDLLCRGNVIGRSMHSMYE